MATVLASQLARLAAKSTNSLDLKAQRKSHSESLLFEPKIASTQDFDTIYQICSAGFQELCQIDNRFTAFSRTIFGEQSKHEDRSQMTGSQNQELDIILEKFLSLVASRVMLKPGIKAVEWLIRRFRIHEYNTEVLLFAILPYHSFPVFTNLLSILPNSLPHSFRWLQPYIESLASPPRQALMNAAVRDVTFLTKWSNQVLRSCKMGHQYQTLITYWATIASDVIIGQLEQNKTGREEARRQKEEELLQRINPILSEGLALREAPDVRVGCFLILTVLVSRIEFRDEVLRVMMEAVVDGRTNDITQAELICLAVLSQRTQSPVLPEKVFEALVALDSLKDDLVVLDRQYDVGNLCQGIVASIMLEVKKQNNAQGLGFIVYFVEGKLFSESQLSRTMSIILHTIKNDWQELNDFTKKSLGNMILRLGNFPEYRSIIQQALLSSEIDIKNIESELQQDLLLAEANTLSTLEAETPADYIDSVIPESYDFYKSKLPHVISEPSFLSTQPLPVFESLAKTFIVASKSSDTLDDFVNLPLLQKSSAATSPLFISFLARFWCGSFPSKIRAVALECTKKILRQTEIQPNLQFLLPYIFYALGDSSPSVRRAATDVFPAWSLQQNTIPSESQDILGKDDIYGYGECSTNIPWLSSEDCSTIVGTIILPNLEEFRLDQKQIALALETALNGSRGRTVNISTKDLKTTVRTSFLNFIAKHVLYTPLWAVKKRLLELTTKVGKVGATSRSRVLLPLLSTFEAFDDGKLRTGCTLNNVDEADLCSQVAGIVAPSDQEGIKCICRIILGQESSPPRSLRVAAMNHIRTTWNNAKTGYQLLLAKTLLMVSQSNDSISGEAMDVVHSLKMKSDVLEPLLESLPSLMPEAGNGPALSKRRRTDQGTVDVQPDRATSIVLQDSLRKVTLVLELVEASKHDYSLGIIRYLFHILADIHSAEANMGMDMHYVQSMILSCLHEAVVQARKGHFVLDSSTIRADLVVDCFRTTTSTQVQQTALMLMSSLAAIAPNLIVHSVMPIFTFMGSNLLRQADDYSALVIERTIESVIPPLIESFQKDKRGPIAGAAELLLSFVAALDHIPSSRRLNLFSALINQLGAKEHLFALLVLIIDRYGDAQVPMNLAIELCAQFDPFVQLSTISQYVDVVIDMFAPKPTAASQFLLSRDKALGSDSVASILLRLPLRILQISKLSSTINRLLTKDMEEAQNIRTVYSHLIEQTLVLTERTKLFPMLVTVCNEFLDSLLKTLSLNESIRSLEILLENGSQNVKRQVLRSLNKRISNIKIGNQTSSEECIKLLPRLQEILIHSSDVILKQTALACVDRIAERFGRSNLNEIKSVAKMISGKNCLAAVEPEIRLMSLLCLTTLTEVLVDGIVPMIPEAVPLTFDYLESSVKQDMIEDSTYSAALGLFGSLFSYIPWMMSNQYLDRFLEISETSTNTGLGRKFKETRISTLEWIAKQIDPQELFSALRRTWGNTVFQGPNAVEEHLMVLSLGIERHSKPIIVKHSQLLTDIFIDILGTRSLASELGLSYKYSNMNFEDIDTQVNRLMINAIYKLNDTNFRPIFVRLLDWANSKSFKAAEESRFSRLIGLYGFLNAFFDTLKSIVTNYSGLIAENAVECMANSFPRDESTSILWYRVLSTLQAAFEHDQDEFWQTPSRFEPMKEALCHQIEKASNVEDATVIINCLTSFASAAESTDNLESLNKNLMRYLRVESADIRLTAVRCEISITESLGEDWLALLSGMLPFISEALEDDDERVEMEVRRWVRNIESTLGESLDSMLQ